MIFGSCPVCKSDISQDRLQQQVTICNSCGWSDNQTAKDTEHKSTKQFIFVATLVSILMIGGFIQTVNWSFYSFEIIPLKVKHFAGIASTKDLHRIAEICTKRHKPQCVEQVHGDLLRNDSANLEVLEKYGAILVNNKKIKLAAQAYSNYFQHGGTGLKAAYEYAKVLGNLERTDESKEYFNYVIQSRPETMQVTVTQKYVDMLYKAGHYREAHKIILNFKKRGARHFMEAKFKELTQILKQQRRG